MMGRLAAAAAKSSGTSRTTIDSRVTGNVSRTRGRGEVGFLGIVSANELFASDHASPVARCAVNFLVIDAGRRSLASHAESGESDAATCLPAAAPSPYRLAVVSRRAPSPPIG